MRERLWEIGLDVPDKEYAEDHFGFMTRRAGPHRFSLERPHSPAFGPQTRADWLVASLIFHDIEEARTEPTARDEKQCMFGMKRQLPPTTDDGRQERRLLAGRTLMPPTPLYFWRERLGPHPSTWRPAELARSGGGGPGPVANINTAATATATATAPRTVAQALGPTAAAVFYNPGRRRALRRRADGA